MGYRVVLAGNAAAAIRAMDVECPDLVLTDIYMDGGDGYELISALRKGGSAIPVVAMSAGRAGYDTLISALHLGADAVIDKPFWGRLSGRDRRPPVSPDLQRSKSTATVFPPLMTMPTRSPARGR